MRLFVLACLVVPIIEVLLIIELGGQIGGPVTVALILLTAGIGVQVVKWQGLSTLLRARERLLSGKSPGQELIEGMMIAVAGVCLLIPGFFTDTVGIVLLTGPLRRPLARHLIKARIAETGQARPDTHGSNANRPGSETGDVIDAEYTRHPNSSQSLPDSAAGKPDKQDSSD